MKITIYDNYYNNGFNWNTYITTYYIQLVFWELYSQNTVETRYVSGGKDSGIKK